MPLSVETPAPVSTTHGCTSTINSARRSEDTPQFYVIGPPAVSSTYSRHGGARLHGHALLARCRLRKCPVPAASRRPRPPRPAPAELALDPAGPGERDQSAHPNRRLLGPDQPGPDELLPDAGLRLLLPRRGSGDRRRRVDD